MIVRFRHLFWILWHTIRRDVHDLEYDPTTQFRWHLVMTVIWFAAMVGFTGAWFVSFGFGSHFTSGTLWMLFFTIWVSLYANFATDFDAMSASLAAEIAAGTPTPGPDRPGFQNEGEL